MGQAIIVEELSKIDAFRQRMQQLTKQFPDMASVEDFEYPLDVMIANGTLNWNEPNTIHRMEEYATSLRVLADSYNLRCSWIITGLHNMVRNIINSDIKVPISNYYPSWTIDRLRLDVPIRADTRQDDIQLIFNQEWQRIKSMHPELQRRARIPESFEQHVRWLCNRLFLGKTGYTIDEESGLDPDYINSSIRKAAKRLGIKLPLGRPSKTKRG